MRFYGPAPRPRPTPDDWHWRFAFLPTRVSATAVVWLEWYWRRLEVVAEGNYAGGYQSRWLYADRREATPNACPWAGPTRGD